MKTWILMRMTWISIQNMLLNPVRVQMVYICSPCNGIPASFWFFLACTGFLLSSAGIYENVMSCHLMEEITSQSTTTSQSQWQVQHAKWLCKQSKEYYRQLWAKSWVSFCHLMEYMPHTLLPNICYYCSSTCITHHKKGNDLCNMQIDVKATWKNIRHE